MSSLTRTPFSELNLATDIPLSPTCFLRLKNSSFSYSLYVKGVEVAEDIVVRGISASYEPYLNGYAVSLDIAVDDMSLSSLRNSKGAEVSKKKTQNTKVPARKIRRLRNI